MPATGAWASGSTTMKSRLIVNPVAGSDEGAAHLPVINARLRTMVDHLDIVMTTGEGDARRAAAQAVEDGYGTIFVAGGDGTLNQALNGVASVPDGLARTIIGIIPIGTGNDFARALGLVEDIDATLDLLATSTPAAIDVGVANGHHFLNVSAGGFMAEVSDAVDVRLKSVAGKIAYLIGGAQVLANHQPVATTVTWQADGTTSTDRVRVDTYAVCNSRQIGGGRLIAPYAVIDDGLLDVCLIEAMPTVDFVALLRRVSNGDHVDDPRVRYFRTATLDLDFERPLKINVDGEVLESSRAAYRILPRAVRVMVPASAAPEA
jgi:diacylglycerol kinase (ATP)